MSNVFFSYLGGLVIWCLSKINQITWNKSYG